MRRFKCRFQTVHKDPPHLRSRHGWPGMLARVLASDWHRPRTNFPPNQTLVCRYATPHDQHARARVGLTSVFDFANCQLPEVLGCTLLYKKLMNENVVKRWTSAFLGEASCVGYDSGPIRSWINFSTAMCGHAAGGRNSWEIVESNCGMSIRGINKFSLFTTVSLSPVCSLAFSLSRSLSLCRENVENSSSDRFNSCCGAHLTQSDQRSRSCMQCREEFVCVFFSFCFGNGFVVRQIVFE